MLPAFEACSVYPPTISDAECVPESNAHVSWSLGGSLLLQSTVCRSPVVLLRSSSHAGLEGVDGSDNGVQRILGVFNFNAVYHVP